MLSPHAPNGRLAGVMPAYGKTHSQGEYVFDWGWADAYERAGGRYYPKLQISIPFTPATGRRFLIRPSEDHNAVAAALVAGAKATLKSIGGSSIHTTFIGHDDWQWLGAQGFLQRTDQQFHWINDGYGSFEDFLAALASRKRKTIKRERRDALASGITIERLKAARRSRRRPGMPSIRSTWTRAPGNGAGLISTANSTASSARRWPSMSCWSWPGARGRYIAGAINFIGSETLYGRNWGCVEDHPFLHFEVCYHQAIEFAIEQGLARVEAGAQGEHKLARGYRPVTTYSAHYIADPRFPKRCRRLPGARARASGSHARRPG